MNKTQFLTVILTLFSTPAFAQSSSVGGVPRDLGAFVPIAALLVVGYLFFRARRKRDKELEKRFVDIENRLEKMEGS